MDQAGKDTGDKHPDIVKTVRNDESHSSMMPAITESEGGF